MAGLSHCMGLGMTTWSLGLGFSPIVTMFKSSLYYT